MITNGDDVVKDVYLQKALQYAPDSHAAPSESARKTVLDYADNTHKLSHAIVSQSWLMGVKNWFDDWRIPRWQLTGMGSLAASLLVVVMIWHENPDDTIQVVSAPDLVQNEAESTQTVQGSQTVAESASVVDSTKIGAPSSQTKAQANIEARVIIKSESTKQVAEIASRAATIKAPVDSSELASVPEATSAQDVVTVPVAPTSAEVSTADVYELSAANTAHSIAAPRNKMKEVGRAQPETKAGLPHVISSIKPAVVTSSLAMELSKQGGRALANKDIQTGELRILYLSSLATNGAADEVTGFRKEMVYIDDEAIAKSLASELEAYNQTMRDWYISQNK